MADEEEDSLPLVKKPGAKLIGKPSTLAAKAAKKVTVAQLPCASF